MSMAGDKVKPEDLFDSLRVIKQDHDQNKKPVSLSFYEKFKHRFTEKDPFSNDKN